MPTRHSFVATLVAYRAHGPGAVVLTNSFGGQRLIPELLRTLADEYAWPEYLLAARPVVPSAPEGWAATMSYSQGRSGEWRRRANS